MTQLFPSPIICAPVMLPADAPERERLHGLIGTAIANLIGGPDEHRHLTDLYQFLTARCNESAIVTQVRVLQLQTELMQQEIAELQRQNTAPN